MVTLFGTTYYTIGTGLVVLALLAPLFFWFSRWLLRPNVEGQPRRRRLAAEGALTLGLLALAAVGLYWDVYLIGQRAKELCDQTGLVVYRRERAQGFVGSSAISFWSKHGFSFVETEYFGTRHRYRMEGGIPTKTQVEELASSHRLDLVDMPVAGPESASAKAIARRGAALSSLDNNEPIAELVEFTIGYGWLDRRLLAWTGFVANPHTCGRKSDGTLTTQPDRVGTSDLVLSTLLPP